MLAAVNGMPGRLLHLILSGTDLPPDVGVSQLIASLPHSLCNAWMRTACMNPAGWEAYNDGEGACSSCP